MMSPSSLLGVFGVLNKCLEHFEWIGRRLWGAQAGFRIVIDATGRAQSEAFGGTDRNEIHRQKKLLLDGFTKINHVIGRDRKCYIVHGNAGWQPGLNVDGGNEFLVELDLYGSNKRLQTPRACEVEEARGLNGRQDLEVSQDKLRAAIDVGRESVSEIELNLPLEVVRSELPDLRFEELGHIEQQ